MTILGQLVGGGLLVTETIQGSGNYNPASRPTITFTDLSQLDTVLGGLKCAPVDNYVMLPFAENQAARTVQVKLLGQDTNPTNGAEFREVQAADNVSISGLLMTAFAIGR